MPLDVPPPPVELVEYRGLPSNEQLNRADEFYSQDFINNYLDVKWKAELYNRDSFIMLYELFLRTEDGDKKKQIVGKLIMFKDKIMQGDHPYKALMLDWRKYQYPEVMEPMECLK